MRLSQVLQNLYFFRENILLPVEQNLLACRPPKERRMKKKAKVINIWLYGKIFSYF